MQIGALQAIQNFRDSRQDADVIRDAMRLADLYEPSGFDFFFLTEHHFHGYAMTPEPYDFLCWMAARTERIRLGAGVTIVPWNDPYRVAAHLINLDYLSGGRALIGIGRGLSKIEMDLFGVDMAETRAIFADGARRIFDTVSTGTYPGSSRFNPRHKRSPMRPTPLHKDWEKRFYCVGMSPPSALEAASLGGRLMCFTMSPWERFNVSHLEPYLAAFEQQHGRKAPPMVTLDVVVVHEDSERAEELAQLHVGDYYDYLMEFYGMAGEHLKSTPGYEDYARGAEIARADPAAARNYYVQMQAVGSPAVVLEKLAERRRILKHPYDLCAAFGVGGMPTLEVEHSIRLFSDQVLPVLKTW